MYRTVAWVALGGLTAALVVAYVLTRPNGPDAPGIDAPDEPEVGNLAAELAGAGDPQGQEAPKGGSGGPRLRPPTPRIVSHPLLEEVQEVVVAEGLEAVSSTAGPELTEWIRTVVSSAKEAVEPPSLTVDYPQDATIFPPEIVPPTFLWHEPDEQADTWLIDVACGPDSGHLYVVSPGNPPPAGPIDPECITENNEIYQPTPYQASAKSWTPSAGVWAAIKEGSARRAVDVNILGVSSSEPTKVLSRGGTTITTSGDRVGAPLFYRDVPLAPALTQKGVIAPLGEYAVTLIGWRTRDISKPESRLLLTSVPTCTNCHSFASDGKTLGMDLDGPQGDQGAYVIAPITEHTVLAEKDVISWNSFPDKPADHKTIGFLSRMSPDGQHVITTLNEAVYVCNFLDYKFLQVFYPTRGILAYYSRSSDQIKALPGADDPKYVHCDAVWSPDGEYLVFARAEARDPYPAGATLPARANDPAETQIQYDLYRMPFDGGRGGKPEPIAGASANGMSNTFPKVSPDGKWIVFVKCRNGQLMRPDSTLWIVPVSGGPARQMRCNGRRMNSWHSFSPNSRWMVFSSKANTPYTQMFLTHIDQNGNDSPAVLVPNSTAANRAVNLPEFLNIPYEALQSIRVPALDYLQHGLRGHQFAQKGMLDEALDEFNKAVQLKPDYWQGHANAAVALIDKGMLDEAQARLGQVLESNPKSSHAHGSVGVILARKGMLDEAMAHFRTALELDPNYSEAYANLGRILLAKGLPEEATLQFRMAVELDVDLVDARLMLAKSLAAQGAFAPAVAELQEATKLAPNNMRPVNDLAWLLAVCPDDAVRDGPRALRLADRACEVTGRKNPVLLSTLAAAYAEVGQFPEAIATATAARDLVPPQDNLLAQGIRQQLELYRKGKACREFRSEYPK